MFRFVCICSSLLIVSMVAVTGHPQVEPPPDYSAGEEYIDPEALDHIGQLYETLAKLNGPNNEEFVATWNQCVQFARSNPAETFRCLTDKGVID